jgi:site-specific DNA-methyltransferase (adenine-specific)
MAQTDQPLKINQVHLGDCIQLLEGHPAETIDLVFADPPYNLQLSGDLYRPNMTKVDAVDDDWDQFESFQAYDEFTSRWLSACKRVLKPDGALWVIGSYHNIYRMGKILQDQGFWILNDVLWIKTNPMPNFRGVRFTNAHETLLWAVKSKSSKYTFNHQAMKVFNDGLQMRSDWLLPICTGAERIKIDGEKAHSTQKPEALLYRVILSSTNPGDLVLDPFFGTGTTGAVARKLHRNWLGIEQDAGYVDLARKRIDEIKVAPFDEAVFDVRDRRYREARIPFVELLAYGLLSPGQALYFQESRELQAHIKPDGKLRMNGKEGSIHQLGKALSGGKPCNGWEHWYFEDVQGQLRQIDHLRQSLREALKNSQGTDGDHASS